MKSTFKILAITIVILLFGNADLLAKQFPDSIVSLKIIIRKSIEKSIHIKIQEKNSQRAKIERNKAYDAYLPKITAEASYTLLNSDIRLPSDMENLLTSTQMLLIKEGTAMKMAGMPIPDAAKVNFTTSYSDPNNPASLQLAKAIQDNLREIPPLQERNILKANLSAQILLFSGLKVPYSIKAANHQIASLDLLTLKEIAIVIKEVIKTYDQLAVIEKTNEVLNNTENMLKEQNRFVENAFKNGLATDLEKQKILLATYQLESKKIELESSKKLVLSKLEQLSGCGQDTLLFIKPKLSDWYISDFSETIMNRNDIKALDEAIIATDYKRKSEYTEYLPKVVAFGKKELYTGDLSTFDPQWYVGVGVKWTIFDGQTARRNAQLAKVDKEILEDKRNDALELLSLSLKKIKFDYEKNIKLEQVATQLLKTAEVSFSLTKKQYEAGLTTMTEYLTSVNALENAQLELIKTKYFVRQSVVEFLDANGKLNEEIIVE